MPRPMLSCRANHLPDTTIMSLVNPVLVVVATWWIGTGVVLYLQQQIRQTGFALIATLVATCLASLLVLKISANGLAYWQSYAGFVSAVVLWGCLELSYYTGLIGGIHERHCPENCSQLRRFRLALGASIWHEISVLVTAIVVVAVCWNAANPAGLYTFMVLWLMRWSAILNLFLGVPNFNADWFPEHLAYAHSYMRRSRVTLFFPFSILLAGIVSICLIINTVSASPVQALATALPCVLLMLAILEHAFMALPIADSALWNRVFAREDSEHNKPADNNLDSQTLRTADTSQHRSVAPLLNSSPQEPVSVTISRVETAAPETLAH